MENRAIATPGQDTENPPGPFRCHAAVSVGLPSAHWPAIPLTSERESRSGAWVQALVSRRDPGQQRRRRLLQG
eukprot:250664-Lingulodinium_polyedra.AAC.1